MTELISNVTAASKPGNFKQLEFCSEKSDDNSGNLVLLRARLKEADTEDVGIVVDDLISKNGACYVNTTCVDE